MSRFAEIFKIIVAEFGFAAGRTVCAGEFTDIYRNVLVGKPFFEALEYLGQSMFIHIIGGILTFGSGVPPLREICPVATFVVEFLAEFAGRENSNVR